MGIFGNEYDANGLPICPSCAKAIRGAEPAARSGDSIAHLRCLWAARTMPMPLDDREAADQEMGAFFQKIGRVLQRIRTGIAHAANRPAA